jgi:small multidrug resistance pump
VAKIDGRGNGFAPSHASGSSPREIRMTQWLFLAMAIISEVIGTSALKASEGFTRLYPSLLVASGYVVAFFFLSLTLRTMPVGVAYAIWSGVGVALITLIGRFWFGQMLDLAAYLGIGLIVAGVIVMNVFSKAVSL